MVRSKQCGRRACYCVPMFQAGTYTAVGSCAGCDNLRLVLLERISGVELKPSICVARYAPASRNSSEKGSMDQGDYVLFVRWLAFAVLHQRPCDVVAVEGIISSDIEPLPCLYQPLMSYPPRNSCSDVFLPRGARPHVKSLDNSKVHFK